jgi:predicted dehydrogenase/threonine dehydrogenase-like Zn-dependent dehydrogenase
MAMKQVLVLQGKAVLEDVPAPNVENGCVLIRLDHSCISIGTEMSGVRASALPLWRRALKQPQNVKKLVQMVASNGLAKTRSLVEGKLNTGLPTGYSAAGTIVALGAGVTDLAVGDRVACAGAQCAFHAEVVCVPCNLVTPVPDEVDFADACTVTLGAIAMQGVRRASPTLGESFVVIGLGILGQMTVQMLLANGCRVIGIDVDRSRIDLAKQLGMQVGIHPDDDNDAQQVARLTDGYGADGVIITAASPSDTIVSSAFKFCRKKGRVVLVGDVGLNLNRSDFYVKEIDFFISSSYGPGRYDNHYEEKGLDYPLAYVRWTENRNMGEYLHLIAEGRVKIKPLVSSVYSIEQASQAYEALSNAVDRPLMVLFSYPLDVSTPPLRKISNPQAKPSTQGALRVAVAGAGGFAKGMHLPNLQVLKDRYDVRAIMSRTGHNAAATAKQFGANYSTTDYAEILADQDVDLVLISSRHDKHAQMVLEALNAGKHVLAEKPLALSELELEQIEAFYATREQSGEDLPILLTGFNRRFSPYAAFIKQQLNQRSNPMIINYRMNAGHIPLDHWVHGTEGGGRNIGEACHIYDLFTFFTGARAISVMASAIHPQTSYYSASDNFVATIRFDDGSVATLTYTSLGAGEYPKEMMEIFCDGKIFVLEDFKKMSVAGARVKVCTTPRQDKGQLNELQCLSDGIARGEWPIPLWQQSQATRISFQVEQQINPQ